MNSEGCPNNIKELEDNIRNLVLHTLPIPEAHHALVCPLSPGDRHAEGDAAGERQGRLGNNSVTAGALSS